MKSLLKKTFALILPMFALTAILPYAALSHAETAETEVQVTETLLMPTSYEQYLPLENPTDVAVNDDFTTIADGSKIYIYNKEKEEYSTYEHPQTSEKENTIKKMQFGNDGILYFIDSFSANLYKLTPEDLSSKSPAATNTGFICNTFTLHGNDLFYTITAGSTSSLFKTTVQTFAESKNPLVIEINGNPALSYSDGNIYYTHGGQMAYKVSADATETVTPSDPLFAVNKIITSFSVCADEVCFTDDGGNFFAYNLTALSYAGKPTDEALHESDEGGYKAVSRHGNYTYAVKDRSIKKYENNESFTDFEIAANSSSVHRLSSATDNALCKNTLVTADGGNNRLSVYSVKENTYKAITTDEPYTKVATDGENVLAVNGQRATLYSLSGEFLFGANNFSGAVVGCAAVYGKYYLVTDNNYYYSIAKGEDGYVLSFIQKTNGLTPKLIASDIYGSLYVACTNNKVYRYEETELMNADEKGEEFFSIEEGATKILVDMNGTLYALKGNEILVYKPEAPVKTLNLTATLVYGQTEETPVSSIAFGAEEVYAYVLYDGNFVSKTVKLDIPNIHAIESANGSTDIDETVFGETQAEFEVVKTNVNAILITFDLSRAENKQYFPCEDYHREMNELTALKIGNTGAYDLIAVYDQDTKSYTTYLTRPTFTTALDESTYRILYSENEQTVGYLTNALNLYKFPYLTKLLTFAQMPKNAEITLLGAINELDYEYYYVSYTDATGAKKFGYIPKTYVTLFNGAPPEMNTETYGDATANTDSVWRMTYLLLGAAAILVLVDYLILRKADEE